MKVNNIKIKNCATRKKNTTRCDDDIHTTTTTKILDNNVSRYYFHSLQLSHHFLDKFFFLFKFIVAFVVGQNFQINEIII